MNTIAKIARATLIAKLRAPPPPRVGEIFAHTCLVLRTTIDELRTSGSEYTINELEAARSIFENLIYQINLEIDHE